MRSCKTISFSFRTNFLAMPPSLSFSPLACPALPHASWPAVSHVGKVFVTQELKLSSARSCCQCPSCCCCCCCCLLYGFIYFSQVQPPSKSCRLVLGHHPSRSPILIPFPFPCLFHVLFCATNFYFMPLPLPDWFLDSS